MNANYHVININLTTLTTDEPIADVPCEDCSYCCQMLSPYLTPDEISSGQYPISLVQPETNELVNNPNIGPKVVIFKNTTGGCSMLVNNKCLIYDNRPIACRQFDCRKGHHLKIPNMTKK